KRRAESKRIREKYPNRIPVVCEKAENSGLPTIEKKKFLVPYNMLVGEFKYIIYKHLNQAAITQNYDLAHDETIYLFVNDISPKAGALFQELYESHCDDDGFLYLKYSGENTLGTDVVIF
ncbi:putative autophagy-related protein 8 atg8, partial [Cardiosporidium cionae]